MKRENENREPTIQELLAENRKLMLVNARLHNAYSQLEELAIKFVKDIQKLGIKL